MAKRWIVVLLLALQILIPSPALAKELVFDGITPQDNTTISRTIAMYSNYGFGFIAGENRDLIEIEIIIDRLITSGSVSAFIYQNNSYGNAGTGTYIATLLQSEDSSPSGSPLNAYILKMKGRATLISGLKYWVYFRHGPASGSALHSWGMVTPTVTGSWAIVGSTGSYRLISNSSSFDYPSYPIARFYLYTPTTIAVTLNSGGTSATYRRSATLRASVNSDGPVTFYANGKKISGCINIQSSGGTALCPWVPSFRGVVSIKARVVPRDSENYDPATSSATNLFVGTRTNLR